MELTNNQDVAQREIQAGVADSCRLRGYPRLAKSMSDNPEHRIFRRFMELAMLNTLRLQAELQNMERLLFETIQDNDNSADPVISGYSKDFYSMREALEARHDLQRRNVGVQTGYTDRLTSGISHHLAQNNHQSSEGSPSRTPAPSTDSGSDEKDDQGPDIDQIEQLAQIGAKLAEYTAAIEIVLNLSKVGSPSKIDVETLRDWLDDCKGGDSFLMAGERSTWSREHEHDFMSLCQRSVSSDYFTRMVDGPLLTFYNRFWGGRKQRSSPIRTYSDHKIRALVKIVGTIIASVLPTITILVLYFVKPPLIRIGLVIIFTALFSFALSVLTSASMEGIFTATATFAAVEVVFIGTTSNGTATNGTSGA